MTWVALVCFNSARKGAWALDTASERWAACAGLSGMELSWSFRTTMTRSVTLVESAAASVGVSGATPPGPLSVARAAAEAGALRAGVAKIAPVMKATSSPVRRANRT